MLQHISSPQLKTSCNVHISVSAKNKGAIFLFIFFWNGGVQISVFLCKKKLFWAISSPQDGQQPSDADVYLTWSFLVCEVREDSERKKAAAKARPA